MIYVWVKLITGIVFVLIPGFSLKNNFKKHPILTILSLIVGIILLFLSIKPMIQDTSDVNTIKNDIAEIKNISKKNYVKNTVLKKLRIVLTNYQQYCNASTADYIGNDFQQRIEDLPENIPRGALSNDTELEKVFDEIDGLISGEELQKIKLLIDKLSFLRTRELNDALLPKQHEIGTTLEVYENCSNDISRFLREMYSSTNDIKKKKSLPKVENSELNMRAKHITVAPKTAVEQVGIYKDLRTYHIGDESIKTWSKLHGQCYIINFTLSGNVKKLTLHYDQYGLEKASVNLNNSVLGFLPPQKPINQKKRPNFWSVAQVFIIPKLNLKLGSNIIRICASDIDNPEFSGDIDDFQMKSVLLKAIFM